MTLRQKYGTCIVCGCTDEAACPEGCSWVEEEHTLCSACFIPDRMFGMVMALDVACRLLTDEYKSMLASACPHVDGKPQLSRIDSNYRSLAARYRRVIKKIISVCA